MTGLVTSTVDGANPQPLGVGAAGSARWSPDGTRIAYVSYSGANSQLQTVDLAAKTTTTLATGVGDGIGWQPKAVTLPPVAPPTVDRLGGGDRVATAVDASRFQFDDAASTAVSARKASVAVLSRMDTFADALSGSALAGAKNGPLLLTPSSSLDPSVLAELRRVLPRGATVYLLGGTGALSADVETTLRAEGFVPRRLAGSERYSTSLAIAREITPMPQAVYVASGENYPDPTARRRFPSPSHGTTKDPRNTNKLPCYTAMRTAPHPATERRDAEHRQRCRPLANL